MKRAPLPLPCSKCLVVPLKDVPALGPRKLRRILPGLLDAQIPLGLSECTYAFARNGAGFVGLVARRADVDAAFAEAPAADGAVALPWAVWRQCHGECPPASENERRAVLLFADDAATVATGRGVSFGAAAEVPADADTLVRTLRMAFGAEGGDVRCLCAGEGAASWARTLRERGVSANAEAVDAPEQFCARALLAAAQDNADGGVFDSATSLARQERGRSWCRLALAAPLMALAVLLFRQTDSLARSGRAASRALSDELSHRVDLLVGYPVSARGDRAVALAKEAAKKRDPSVPAWMMRPAASRFLEQALSAAARTEGATVFSLRADDDGFVVSGNAPDEEAAQRFATDLRESGMVVQLEVSGKAAEDGVIRFVATVAGGRP